MEPQLDQTPLYLQGFAPLIQLWAGICLLFFYESLLNNSPFSSLCSEIRSLYNDFINRYNGLIQNEVMSSDEYVKDLWSNNFIPTIKCVASLCFFYSAFILAFIGIETNSQFGASHYCALQIINTIVWLYLIAAVCWYKKSVFHGFKSSIILSMLLLIYFHFHFSINNLLLQYVQIGEIWDKSSITIYTVFTCIGGVILICLRLFLSYTVLQFQKMSIRSIYREFEVFANYNLGKINMSKFPQKKLGRIMTRCNNKFKANEIQAIDSNAFLDSMKEEVANEYIDFTKKWWIKLY